MFKCLKRIDWNLLHTQKRALVNLRARHPKTSVVHKHLSGVIHLLDALQDDAEAAGLWVHPLIDKKGAKR